MNPNQISNIMLFIRTIGITIFLAIISLTIYAQEGAVGIGTTSPHESAILEIESATKGVIFPIHDKESISNPAMGLMVYDWDDMGYYFYDGAKWRAFSTAADSLWNISGENIYSIPSKKIAIGTTSEYQNSKVYIKPDPLNVEGLYIDNPIGGAFTGLRVRNRTENGIGIWIEDHNVVGFSRAGYLYTNAEEGIGVHGHSTDESSTMITKGGLFQADGYKGIGVHGVANHEITTFENKGGLFEAAGTKGIGVHGVANHTTSAVENKGGLFESEGLKGIGVHGVANHETSTVENKGGLFESRGIKGIGVHGHATNTDGTTSRGGLFVSGGMNGTGVVGLADNFFGNGNTGGSFASFGTNGFGVKSTVHGVDAIGLHVLATNPASTSQIGALVEAEDNTGIGVKSITNGANATSIIAESTGEEALGLLATSEGDDAISIKGVATGDTGIAGVFESNGSAGHAIYATGNGVNKNVIYAISSGDESNGVRSISAGKNGTGVYGSSIHADGGIGGEFYSAKGTGIKAIAQSSGPGITRASWFESHSPTGYGVYSITSGDNSKAIYGYATNTGAGSNYGGQFIANGNQGSGVYAISGGSSGRAVLGYASKATGSSYGGYFSSASSDGTGIFAEGNKHAGLFNGNVEVHASDGDSINLSMLEGTGYGFEFQYNGNEDDLRLWSKKFSGNEAVRMTWKKNGRVGIGTEAPTEKLDVVGNVKVSGNVFASCGTLSCSDQRYKTNIRTINNPLSLISNIDGVYYDWKVGEFPERDFSEQEQVGVIAQQLEKTFPQLVHTDDNGYKSVAYDKLTPILLEAIKELNKELLEAQVKYSNLQLEMKNQDARLSALEGLFDREKITDSNTSED